MKGTLKRKTQFQRVYTKGAKAVGHHMVAFALPAAAEDAEVLVGVVASRKVGKAHRRNKAKRRLRACFQGMRAHVEPGAWVVLVARASLAEPRVAPEGLREEMQRLLARLGILENHPRTRTVESSA